MKKLLTLIVLTVIAVVRLAAADNDGARIVFDNDHHDFGNISENGGKVSCEFTFRNEGNAPLVIVSATVSCGCTKPEFPKRPVEPGAESSIKVTYNPKGRPGEFSKVVKVKTNAPDAEFIKLRISGVVIPNKK